MKWGVIFLALLSSTATAQTVEWGPQQELATRHRSAIESIIGSTDSSFYAFRVDYRTFGTNEYFVDCYSNSTMKKSWEIRLDMPRDSFPDHELQFDDVKMLKGVIFFFYTRKKKKEGSFSVVGRTYDRHGNIISSDKLIQTIKGSNDIQRGRLDYVASNDSDQVLLLHHRTFRRFSKEQFELTVIDRNLETVWNKHLKLPYEDLMFSVSEFQFDKDGNFFMLSLFEPHGKNSINMPEAGVRNNRYKIIGYLRSMNKIKEFEVDLGNKWASSITLSLNNAGKLTVGGFYSNTEEFSIAGTFYLLIDTDKGKTEAVHLKPFEDSFLLKFMSKKSLEKGEELESFYFNNMLTLPDGGTVFVAEKYYEIAYTTLDPRTNMMSATMSHYYNEIILVKIKKQGGIEWTVKVPKRQYSTNDDGYYLSYSLALVDSSVHILFNDHKKNFGSTDRIKYMNKSKRAKAKLVSISADGTRSSKEMFNSSIDKAIFKPKVYYQLDPKNLIIFAQKGRDYRFGKVTFE